MEDLNLQRVQKYTVEGTSGFLLDSVRGLPGCKLRELMEPGLEFRLATVTGR